MRITRGKSWRPQLRTILMVVNLVVLLLPLGSIYLLRIYENKLVRQTEVELIAQGVLIATLYKQHLQELRAGTEPRDAYGIPVRLPGNSHDYYGIAVKLPTNTQDYYRPIPASLDLASDPVLPPRPDLIAPKVSADPLALKIGAKITPLLAETLRITLSATHVIDYQGVVVTGKQDRGLSFLHIPEAQRADSICCSLPSCGNASAFTACVHCWCCT